MIKYWVKYTPEDRGSSRGDLRILQIIEKRVTESKRNSNKLPKVPLV